MPYPEYNFILCPTCGYPFNIIIGEKQSSHKCDECGTIITVTIEIGIDDFPGEVDKRYIC